jgi:hypothetical protein
MKPMRWMSLMPLVLAQVALAADRPATPSDYRNVIAAAAPGDTVRLAAGTYALMPLTGKHGSDGAPIVITGPASGAPARIAADPGPCCDTIEIRDSSWLVLRDLTIDANHVDGAFGINAKGAAPVHHITVERCTFLNHDGSQQHVAISTKTTAWDWIIRGNTITNAGTGLYLGNSDGSQPFIAGLIEGNTVRDTIGYNMEIKYQQPRPNLPGIPQGASRTIIRGNTFIKNDRPSPDGDRPNVLVGGFPASGAGSMDRYEIYGNLFLHNTRESLLQASGRVSIHDNLFVDVTDNAILLRNHDLPLRQAWVYHNTIYAAGTGIRFGNAAADGDAVIANLIFATTPSAGPIADHRDDLTASVASAASYVMSPALTGFDLHPLPGQAMGSAVDLSKVSADSAFDQDYDGTSKGALTHRGAYAGPAPPMASDGGTAVTDAATGGDASTTMTPPATVGCSCDVSGRHKPSFPWVLLVLVALSPVTVTRGRRTR